MFSDRTEEWTHNQTLNYEHITAWCTKHNRSMQDGQINDVVTEQISYARKKFRRIYSLGKADDRNCIQGHPKMSDEKLELIELYLMDFYPPSALYFEIERSKTTECGTCSGQYSGQPLHYRSLFTVDTRRLSRVQVFQIRPSDYRVYRHKQNE